MKHSVGLHEQRRRLLQLILVGMIALAAGTQSASAGVMNHLNHWPYRNAGFGAGSTSFYPLPRTTGGYYFPSYRQGGQRPFGYQPAFIPGQYPGIYGGYQYWHGGPSGYDLNRPHR